VIWYHVEERKEWYHIICKKGKNDITSTEEKKDKRKKDVEGDACNKRYDELHYYTHRANQKEIEDETLNLKYDVK